MNSVLAALIVLGLQYSLNAPIDYSEKTSWNCIDPTQQSPIDIPFFNKNGDIIYQAYPSHYLNRTFYDLINDVRLTLTDAGPFSIKPLSSNGNFGNVYATINKDYSSYSLKEIRFHIYSEHTFEGMKTEVEMQLIHTPNRDGKVTEYNSLAIAVFFSASWDSDSEFLSLLTETLDPASLDVLTKYSSTKIMSLDVNQFIAKHEPYYYYTGSGTIPDDCNSNYHWFLMKKVQKMSWNQLEQLQSLIHNSYPNGNSRRTKAKASTTPSGRIEFIGKSTFIQVVAYNFALLFFFF